jgi:hypothetical protein
MNSNRERLFAALAQKETWVTDLPPWMLSPGTIESLRRESRLAVVEISGRDSVAAAIKAGREGRFDAVLPTIVYTGTEYGDWEVPLRQVSRLKRLLDSESVRTFDPIFLGDPRFFRLLSGRHMATIQDRFGFYSPCPGCHLYLHSIRIPLSKALGSSVIVAGERASHDGRMKLSQLPGNLEVFESFVRRFGPTLLLPLREIVSGEQVEVLIGEPWDQGDQQMDCVLSRNYWGVEGPHPFDPDRVRGYLEEFAIPLADRVIRAYLEGTEPDYESVP